MGCWVGGEGLLWRIKRKERGEGEGAVVVTDGDVKCANAADEDAKRIDRPVI